MKNSSNIAHEYNDAKKIIFPEVAAFNHKDLTTSLEEIIISSEQQLSYENKRRQKSPAIDYAPFLLKPV